MELSICLEALRNAGHSGVSGSEGLTTLAQYFLLFASMVGNTGDSDTLTAALMTVFSVVTEILIDGSRAPDLFWQCY